MLSRPATGSVCPRVCVCEFIEPIFFPFSYKKHLIAGRAIFLDANAKGGKSDSRSFIIAKIVTVEERTFGAASNMNFYFFILRAKLKESRVHVSYGGQTAVSVEAVHQNGLYVEKLATVLIKPQIIQYNIISRFIHL